LEIKNHPMMSMAEVIRPTVVEVNLSILKNNFQKIKEKISGRKIMPVLKSNAYGHGLIRVAQLMEELGADYLGVAVLEEGILLRESGIKSPILVLGGIIGNQIPHFIKHDLTITASSVDKLVQIEEAAKALNKKAKVHLKIDTGLERIGVHYYNAEGFLENSLKYNWMEIEGIYSHLACSGNKDKSYTKMQLERFDEVLYFYEKKSLEAPLRHIANSGAILQHSESYYDVVRPGIMLYGVYPSDEVEKTIEVTAALNWKSRVVYFKVIKADHPVGYGATWRSNHDVRAVTVPVGYGDGYMRSMSHKAKVLIKGNVYPVVGTIAMDQIIVNIEDNSVFNGDEVILVGGDRENKITVEELAAWSGTIPYEILTNINTRVPRIYV
jgi:alanine racemase